MFYVCVKEGETEREGERGGVEGEGEKIEKESQIGRKGSHADCYDSSGTMRNNKTRKVARVIGRRLGKKERWGEREVGEGEE